MAAMIPAQTLKVMQERSEEFNTSTHPCLGIRIRVLVVQSLGKEVPLTSLINSGLKEISLSVLNMMHYLELADTKGHCADGRGVRQRQPEGSSEARCLADQVELYLQPAQ